MVVGIKCLDSIYIVDKRKKFNIAVIAITEDGRKLMSQMFATHSDIETLYRASKSVKNILEEPFECMLSTGICRIQKHPTVFKNHQVIYTFAIEIGGIASSISMRAYDDFVDSINEAHGKLEIFNTSPVVRFTKNRAARRAAKKAEKQKGVFEKWQPK